jgi:hypothetical protein
VIVEQALQSKLATTGAISALVGARISYVKATQDVTAPYITIQKVSEVPDCITTGKRYVQARMQVSMFGITYLSIKTLETEIRLALDKYTGLMGGVGGLWIVNCKYDNATDIGFDDTLKLYGLAADYLIKYSLAITN